MGQERCCSLCGSSETEAGELHAYEVKWRVILLCIECHETIFLGLAIQAGAENLTVRDLLVCVGLSKEDVVSMKASEFVQRVGEGMKDLASVRIAPQGKAES